MNPLLATAPLLACLVTIGCTKPLGKEVLERHVGIKPDRFASLLQYRDRVSVSELVSLLRACSDENGAKLLVKEPKILSTAKFVVEGKDVARENLVLAVTRSQQTYAIELLFNLHSFMDFEEADYALQMRNAKQELVDADRWFADLYLANEHEIRDPALLKNKRVAETEADLFAVYQALKAKPAVHDLKVIAILSAYYFIGKNDKSDFILPASFNPQSTTYGVTYFLPKAGRGFPPVMFFNDLFDSEEQLPTEEDLR